MYSEVLKFVVKERKASTSLIQRKFGLGYNRAARIVDLLQERGVVGPANGSKPREVFVQDTEEE
jgi:S-DNA-T family DNA segregation ATPase FtsK/SpoIIIE